MKVAAQGHYCISEEKTPLGWFKGRSNEISYRCLISSLCIFVLVDTVVAFFYCLTLLYGKNTKCKAGKFARNFFVFHEKLRCIPVHLIGALIYTCSKFSIFPNDSLIPVKG